MLRKIAMNTLINFSKYITPERTESESDIRIVTDDNRKIFRLIDPMSESDSIKLVSSRLN